jgi:tRNA A37 threonylcarbamoyladenosine biosynthesis protein TsaE
MSLFANFQHINLTQDQQTALEKLQEFFGGDTQVFMLKGYAGSGKTTILKGLVDYFEYRGKNVTLMAPTGRAAKVIREKTGYEANTIHKTIYSYDDLVEVEEGDSFYYYYNLRENFGAADKMYIVDEASMLSDSKNEGEFFRFGSGHLLSDLISFTRVNHSAVNAKIIFVGDPCQLPPVGDNSSKAFDAGYLDVKFNLSSMETEMKEVKRQGEQSGILKSAAKIRRCITAGYFNDFNVQENGRDIFNPSFEQLIQTWENADSPKVIIARKNKTCLDLNHQIRERKFGDGDLPLQPTDILIMGANNTLKGVYNGEFAIVNRVSDTVTSRSIFLRDKKTVTLTWRDVELVYFDEEGFSKSVTAKILENYLNGESNLKPEEVRALYVDFTTRHKQLKPGTPEFKDAIMRDEFFNCLMVKYAYAITCHKAQGGEWENVFTVWDYDSAQGFNCYTDPQRKTDKTNTDFYRWAYTAITRASKKLYAINPPFFNSYSTFSIVQEPILKAINDFTGTSAEVDEVCLDSELIKELNAFGLMGYPMPIQDHFIKVQNTLRKKHIDIVGWEKLGYEIRYTLQKDQAKAVFKTYTNLKNEFKNSFSNIPNLSVSLEFNKELAELLDSLTPVSIKRETIETITDKIEFDFEIDEKFPFTQNLYDDLANLFNGTNIFIDDVEHQRYKERYSFKRSDELAVVDFEYNGNGFWGRVLPVSKKTNSQKLILDIQTALQTLKKESHAI